MINKFQEFWKFFLKFLKAEISGHRICYRVLASCSVQILALMHGISLGWSTSNMSLDILKQTSSNDAKVSWMAALYVLGVFLGVICMDLTHKLIGQKRSLHILSCIPILHVLCVSAANAKFSYFAQIFIGVSAASYLLIHKLVVEIVQPNLHVAFSITTLSVTNIGLLLGSVIQTQKKYSITITVLSMAHLLIMSIFPESPSYAIKAGKIDVAANAFKFYNNDKENVSERTVKELKDLEQSLQNTAQGQITEFKDYFSHDSINAYVDTIVLMLPICQSFVMLHYMPYIIKTIDITVDTQICTILLGLSQIFGTLGLFGLKTLCNHKTVYLLCNSGVTFSLIAFGLFYQLSTETFLIKFKYVTLALFMLIVFCGNNGIFLIIFDLAREITPTKIRHHYSRIVITIMSLCLFTFIKLFPLSLKHLGLANYFFLVFLISMNSLIYLKFQLPTPKNNIISSISSC